MKTLAAFLGLLISALAVFAVGLAWDPSPDPNVVGYAIYYGTNSGSYQTRVDVGDVTNCVITIPTNDGYSYFFVATAYTIDAVESLPSNEVSYTPGTNIFLTWKPSRAITGHAGHIIISP